MFRDSRCRRFALLLVVLNVATIHLEARRRSDFTPIDRIVAQAIDEKKFPGAVVIVGHDGHIVFHRRTEIAR